MDDGDRPDEEKDAEKKERSSADDNGKSHDGVCDETVHEYPIFEKFIILTTDHPQTDVLNFRSTWNLSVAS